MHALDWTAWLLKWSRRVPTIKKVISFSSLSLHSSDNGEITFLEYLAANKEGLRLLKISSDDVLVTVKALKTFQRSLSAEMYRRSVRLHGEDLRKDKLDKATIGNCLLSDRCARLQALLRNTSTSRPSSVECTNIHGWLAICR